MRVNTIYSAFMGEVNPHGIGAPCVFVRFSGCNLRCYKNLGMLCDTPEALSFNCGEVMTPEQIFERVLSYRIPLVCLTGGEPLCQPTASLLRLFSLLRSHEISIVVETNGSRCFTTLKGAFPEVSFVVDYKMVSSGENLRMLQTNWFEMGRNDWLKFVIYNSEDIQEMFRWCEQFGGKFKGSISAGLFWGSPYLKYGKADGTAEELVHRILEHPEYNIQFNFQIHKLISLYDQNLPIVQKTIVPKDL